MGKRFKKRFYSACCWKMPDTDKEAEDVTCLKEECNNTVLKQQQQAKVKAKTRSPRMTETEAILSQLHEMYNDLSEGLARLARKLNDLALMNAEILSRNFVTVEEGDRIGKLSAFSTAVKGDRIVCYSHDENENHQKGAKVFTKKYETNQVNHTNDIRLMVETHTANQSTHRRHDDSTDVGAILVMMNDLEDNGTSECIFDEPLKTLPFIENKDRHQRENSERKSDKNHDDAHSDFKPLIHARLNRDRHAILKHDDRPAQTAFALELEILSETRVQRNKCVAIHAVKKPELRGQGKAQEMDVTLSVNISATGEQLTSEEMIKGSMDEQLHYKLINGIHPEEVEFYASMMLTSTSSESIHDLEEPDRVLKAKMNDELAACINNKVKSLKKLCEDVCEEMKTEDEDCKEMKTEDEDCKEMRTKNEDFSVTPERLKKGKVEGFQFVDRTEHNASFKKVESGSDRRIVVGSEYNTFLSLTNMHEPTVCNYVTSLKKLCKDVCNALKDEALTQLDDDTISKSTAAVDRFSFTKVESGCYERAPPDNSVDDFPSLIKLREELIDVLERAFGNSDDGSDGNIWCKKECYYDSFKEAPNDYSCENEAPADNLKMANTDDIIENVVQKDYMVPSLRSLCSLLGNNNNGCKTVKSTANCLKTLHDDECVMKVEHTNSEEKKRYPRSTDNELIDESTADNYGAKRNADNTVLKKESVMATEHRDTVFNIVASHKMLCESRMEAADNGSYGKRNYGNFCGRAENGVFFMEAVDDDRYSKSMDDFIMKKVLENTISKKEEKAQSIVRVLALKKLCQAALHEKKIISTNEANGEYESTLNNNDCKYNKYTTAESTKPNKKTNELPDGHFDIKDKTDYMYSARPTRKLEDHLPLKSTPDILGFVLPLKTLCKAITDKGKSITDKTKHQPIYKFDLKNGDLKANTGSTRKLASARKKKKPKDRYFNETVKSGDNVKKVLRRPDKNLKAAAYTPVPFLRTLCQAVLDGKQLPNQADPDLECYLSLINEECKGKNTAARRPVRSWKKRKEFSDGQFGDGHKASYGTKSTDRPASLKPMDFCTNDIEELSKSITFISDISTIFSTYDCEYRFVPKLEAARNLQDLMGKGLVFDEIHAKFICFNILDILRFLQSYGIIHTDICPRKVVLNQQGYPCLTGYENATVKGQNLQEHRPVARTLVEYTSPEKLLKGHVTEATDIFSTGVVGIHLIYGRPPHKAVTRRKTKENILNENFIPKFEPDGLLSKPGKRFLVSCIRKDISKRFSLKSCGPSLIDSVEWFKDYKKDQLHNLSFPSPFLPILMEWRQK